MTAGVRMLAYNPNDVKPGWIAFFVVMALLAGTFLLWRNMNKQLGKIKVPYRREFRELDATEGGVAPPANETHEEGERPPG